MRSVALLERGEITLAVQLKLSTAKRKPPEYLPSSSILAICDLLIRSVTNFWLIFQFRSIGSYLYFSEPLPSSRIATSKSAAQCTCSGQAWSLQCCESKRSRVFGFGHLPAPFAA